MRWLNFFLLILLLAGCKQEQLTIGEPAPALAAFDLQGKPTALSQWQGRPIYLNFWSASCGGCLAEMEALSKLSEQWQGKVVVLAINTDADDLDIMALLRQRRIHYPVIRDQLNITQERYQVIGTPTSFLLDAQGRVIAQHQGAHSPQELADIFRRLAQEG